MTGQPRFESIFAPSPTLRRRAGAFVVDVAIAGSLMWCAVLAWLTALTPSDSHANATPISIIFLIVSGLWLAAIGMFYIPFEEAGAAGQTVGKRMFGLRVIRLADGRPLGTGVALGRYVARLTDLIAIGVLWAILDSHRRALHDYIAGTVVVDAATHLEHESITKTTRRFGTCVAVLAGIDMIGIVTATLILMNWTRR